MFFFIICIFRDGFCDLMRGLQSKEVPLLIFSAGLGDVILEVLKQETVLLSNLAIISNFMKFNNEVSSLLIVHVLVVSTLSFVMFISN